MRTYNTSVLDRLIGNCKQKARYPWPDDCHIQGGGNGIVLTSGSIVDALEDPAKAVEVLGAALGKETEIKHYRTAFFEAFPRAPDTFLRGEGKTIEEAEDQAWVQFQKVRSCTVHEFERRGYRTGAGVCKCCGMFGVRVFDKTLDPCFVCGRDDNKASYGTDKFDRWHCETCFHKIPEAEKSDIHKSCDRMRAYKD